MKLSFHPFGRWIALCLDGTCVGYMDHRDGRTALHLRKDAPDWLKNARAQGSWESNGACRDAVKEFRDAQASLPDWIAPVKISPWLPA